MNYLYSDYLVTSTAMNVYVGVLKLCIHVLANLLGKPLFSTAVGSGFLFGHQFLSSALKALRGA